MNEKPRILFVDDEKKFVEAMAKVLRAEGFSVRPAYSGNEALDIFQSERFDLIITDLKMPVMDGIELIRHMRQLNPNQRIIVITAFPSQCMPWNRRLTPELPEAEGLGTLDYLVKPFSSKHLLDIVRKSLEREVPEEALAEVPSIEEQELPQEAKPTEPQEGPAEIPITAGVEGAQAVELGELFPPPAVAGILKETAKAIGDRVACALVSSEGVPIAEVNPAEFPRDFYSGEFARAMGFLRETLVKVGSGHLEESLIHSDDQRVLTRFIAKGRCYLCIVTDLSVSLGTLRTVANKTIEKLHELVE